MFGVWRTLTETRNESERMKTEKIYGAPGTGKTTQLMNVVVDELKSGLSIEDISYMGFTKAACTEALTRAEKVAVFPEKKRYWFKTIHATCLELLMKAGLGNERQIARWVDLKGFCEANGLEVPNLNDDNTLMGGQVSTGSAFFSTYSYLLNTFRSPEQFQECPHASTLSDLNYPELHKAWDEWKVRHKLMDFSDMLIETYGHKLTVPTTVLIVDEFQDISPLQLALVRQFAEGKESVYVAGDDDQALYGFQGADPKLMLNFDANKVNVLGSSYRCPEEVWAQSMQLIEKNVNRQPKEVVSRGKGGRFSEITTPRYFNHVMYDTHGSVFILARTNQLVGKIAWQLAFNGVLFRYLDGEKERVWGWSKKRVLAMNRILRARNSYYEFNRISQQENWANGTQSFLRCYMRAGITQVDPTTIKVKIGTIHSAKGREADTVVIFNDLTARIVAGMEDDMEAERRVWYVAMTRARQSVVWVDGFFRTGTSFQLGD